MSVKSHAPLKIVGRFILSSILATVFCLALTGCGGKKAAAPEAELWPREWEGRERATDTWPFIYAARGGEADDLERLHQQAARMMEARYDGKPGRGVLIALDKGEDPPLGDPGDAWDIILLAALPVNVAVKPDAEALAAQRRAVTERAEKQGIPFESSMIGMTPLVIEGELKARLVGIAPEAVETADWVMVLPTARRMKLEAKAMMDAVFEKQEIGGFRRAAMAPFISAGRSMMVDEMRRQQLTVVLRTMIKNEPDWSLEKRAELEAALLQEEAEKQMERARAMPRFAGPDRARPKPNS